MREISKILDQILMLNLCFQYNSYPSSNLETKYCTFEIFCYLLEMVSKQIETFLFLIFPLRFSSLTFSGGTLSSHIINSHIVWEKQGKSQKGHNTNNNWSNVRKGVIRGFIGGLI